MPEWIDLRSDTVTKPTLEMRRAMAEAEVGDDVYGEDQTVNRLEQRAAEIFQREAALFVPTGSMGNLICIRIHCDHGNEVICESRGLISLEYTHNIAGGRVLPTAVQDEICDRAHDRGIPVHLDAARIFNAATYLGKSVADITRKVDSLMFCLSKGLGAPVGSMVVGSRAFIEKARVFRKMFGGGMRQVGVLAAAGLVALEKHPPLLARDHAKARRLAEALGEIPDMRLQPKDVQTSILVFDVFGTGMSAPDLSAKLKERGVLANAVDPKQMRMVTHYDVSEEEIERALRALQEIFAAARKS